jgi:hypothetical protein
MGFSLTMMSSWWKEGADVMGCSPQPLRGRNYYAGRFYKDVSPTDFEKLNLCFIRVHPWLKIFLPELPSIKLERSFSLLGMLFFQ